MLSTSTALAVDNCDNPRHNRLSFKRYCVENSESPRGTRFLHKLVDCFHTELFLLWINFFTPCGKLHNNMLEL